ncbi:unnamed protein product [Rotaria magnacalcarata]|uniref:F-box domain-containing protein n=1 Tax=Rotaria magnacalcarata TaxID=392030 RepID=A0A818Z7M0_9BILA|nr:unnamed protein product [Rotaria magnacalcarata]
MTHSMIAIMDCPDEMILAIWNKLDNIECLVRLSITVRTLDDWLCLFDGQFRQLQHLYVLVEKVDTPTLTLENLKTIASKKCFSLTSYCHTKMYDIHILPIIRQMVYLKELALFFPVDERSRFIDGIHLENEIIIYLSHLQRFTFNITTHTESTKNEVHLQSNDDIRRTFLNWRFGQVNCYISHYPDSIAQCHIFSLPCHANNIYCISYGFQGDICRNGRHLYLSDRVYPFKHEFFLRIARAFPLVTHLSVSNNRVRDDEEETNNKMISIVEFDHLTHLSIYFQRAINAEQFLVDTYTRLPNFIHIYVSYNRKFYTS